MGSAELAEPYVYGTELRRVSGWRACTKPRAVAFQGNARGEKLLSSG